MKIYSKKTLFYLSRCPILLLLAFNFSVYIFLHFAISDGLKVQIRQALITSYLKDSGVFLAHPDSLPNFNFISYRKENLSKFFEKNKNSIKQHYKVNDTLSIIEKAKSIALSYSRNGGMGCGDYSDDLMKNIEWTTTGGGCCSDHAQVFVALSLLNGLYAREVGNTQHTFNEFWDGASNKWVWIDPQYCLLAKDRDGNYLSLFQIYSLFKVGGRITWVFFGNSMHLFRKISPYEHDYYKPSSFSSVVLTMSNRVFLQDSWNKKLRFLPKDLRQAILIITGIDSQYSLWGDDSTYFAQLEKTRSIFLALVALFLLVNFSLIFYFYKSKTCRNL